MSWRESPLSSGPSRAPRHLGKSTTYAVAKHNLHTAAPVNTGNGDGAENGRARAPVNTARAAVSARHAAVQP